MTLRYALVGIGLVAAGAACKGKPAGPPAGASGRDAGAVRVAAAGRAFALTPSATWAGMTVAPVTPSVVADADTFAVTFALAPDAPVTVVVPRGDRLDVAPLPAVTTATPLPPTAYEFTRVPATRAPRGFRFATRPDAPGPAVTLEVTPGDGDAYTVALGLGGPPQTGTLGGAANCLTSNLADTPAIDPALAAQVAPATAALGRELAAHLAEFDANVFLLRVVVRVLGRELLDVERLRATVADPPCGRASLSFVCDQATCPIEQGGQARTLARGDSLTMGTGTTTRFLAGTP